MKTVIYRGHYGFVFIENSIKSIEDWADRIVVVMSRNSWCPDPVINYLGKPVTLKNPEDLDAYKSLLEKHPKVEVIEREFATPHNQWGKLVNEFNADYVLTLEPDMEIPPGTELPLPGAGKAICFANQTEFWKTKEWRVPQRRRIGPVIYNNPKKVRTRLDNVPLNAPILISDKEVWNWGFCLPEETMLYKHLLAIGFSKHIGDSIPNERWYEDKWLNWSPELENLEIAKGKESRIKRAIPYEKN